MVKLSEHFTYKNLLRFTLPSILMLIFTSVYGVADGFFVSNFVGKEAFTAVNFIMPVLMILGGIGFLFGTGGSALVAKIMGEGDYKKANAVFSFIIYVSIICGFALSIVGIAFLPQIASWLGAEGELLSNCVLYGRIILSALPAYILQFEFQCLFATAEKPKLGLYITLASGITNFILDAIFIALLNWGLVGAALATAIGQFIGGILPVIYFAKKNSSLLKLTKPEFDFKALLQTIYNGASELLGNISMSVISILYNIQLLKYAGEDGVAAYGVLMYLGYVFLSVFIGYSIGIAPVISYHYGAESYKEVKSLLKKNLIIITAASIIMFVLAELLANPISKLFVGYDRGLFELTKRAFFFYSFTFLVSGYSIMGSSFYTALNNGFLSALISFLRTLVFQIIAVFTLPLIWKVDGVWLSVVAAEFLSAIITFILLISTRNRFHYN